MVNQGPPGEKGPTGDKGPPGDKGPSGGATGYVIRVGSATTIQRNQGNWATVYCPDATKHAVGGGLTSDTHSGFEWTDSFPLDRSVDGVSVFSGWKIFVTNTSQSYAVTVKAYVICVNATP